jgi:CheY-like chemotaxis protein
MSVRRDAHSAPDPGRSRRRPGDRPPRLGAHLSPPDGFEVVAACADGQQAVHELPAIRSDVVLMDIRMPVLDGIAATEKLHAGDDPLNVLVLTTFGEDEVLWGQSSRRGRVRAQGLFGRGSDRGGAGSGGPRGVVRPRSGARACLRGDGEDPRRQHLRQARGARPRRRDRLRLRPWCGHTRRHAAVTARFLHPRSGRNSGPGADAHPHGGG